MVGVELFGLYCELDVGCGDCGLDLFGVVVDDDDELGWL